MKLLSVELEKAKAAHDKEEAAKIKAVEDMHRAAHEAQFAGLRDLNITEIKDATSTSVLSTVFRISYIRHAWNGNETLPEPVSVSGFNALAPNVLTWIVERHPEKIPESILALAPGDVDEALDRYFVGLRRGYLTA